MFSKKFLTIFISIFLLFSSILVLPVSSETVNATSNTWYVDDDGGPDIDFTCIQDAINASSDGDTIFVYNGTYNENIVINKSFLTLQGEDNENTIINSKKDDKTIFITADNIQIKNFKIKNEYNNKNIYMHYLSQSIIEENKIISGRGITLYETNKVMIKNNYITNYIYIFSSNNNEINYNHIFNGRISLLLSSYNTISSNLFDGNNQNAPGISIGDLSNPSTGNSIINNIIKNYRSGLDNYYADNEICYNDFLNNKENANVQYIGRSKWYHNYWGKSDRFPFDWKTHIPRPIYGLIPTYIGDLHVFNVDWHPAKTPNCDFGGET